MPTSPSSGSPTSETTSTNALRSRFDLQGRLSSTGGDIAPDRSTLVIRTYTDAWEWDLGPLTVAEALAAQPAQIPLRYQRQGEAITYTLSGSALVTTCEDVGCTAHIYSRDATD